MNEKYLNILNLIDKSKVKFDEPMKNHTTIKIGGNADVMVIPEDVDDIINTVKYAKENNVNITVIGNGSKLLVLDGGIRGIVLKLSSKYAKCEVDGDYVVCQSGMKVPTLARIALDNSLSGLEFAAGIPGNVGGAVFMNAGCYGSEMKNVVDEVTYLDNDLNVQVLKNEECNFGYRTSIFKEDNIGIILAVKFKLKKGNKDEIRDLMQKNNDARREKQPLEYPSAGSIFKRPEGFFVGKIVDDMGLKGYMVGGAQVSTKHSGFIINKKDASAKDVLDLIKYIKEKAKETFNVNLENEIIVIGEEK